MADLAAYAGMFWSAFLAATILPGASEVLLVALLVGATGEPWNVVMAATIGNTLGSVANWACGRFLSQYRDRRWFPVSSAQIDLFSGLFQRYGMASLLFARAPLISDALTVAADPPDDPRDRGVRERPVTVLSLPHHEGGAGHRRPSVSPAISIDRRTFTVRLRGCPVVVARGTRVAP